MSLIKANAVQIGQSPTATQNFTLAVPSSPDGTIKLARGNAGATTQDVISVDASGNINGLVKSTSSTTARSLANRFADVVNVKDFGAVGDGVTDDTTAIQAALNSGALAVYFPATASGYRITSKLTIATSNQVLYGDGMFASYINLASHSFDVFEITAVGNVQIRNLGAINFGAASSGYFINAAVPYGVLFENVYCNNLHSGILCGTVGSSAGGSRSTIKGSQISNIAKLTGYGIIKRGTSEIFDVIDTQIGRLGTIVSADNAAAGILLQGGVAINLQNLQITGAGNPLLIQPNADNVSHVTLDRVWCDTSSGNGMLVDGSSGVVTDLRANQSWFSSCAGDGIRIVGNARDVKINGNNQIHSNLGGGIITGVGATLNGLSIQDNSIGGNGGNGIQVAGGINSFSIQNNQIGTGSVFGANANGIALDAGATNNFVISGNNLQGNTGLALINNATVTAARIEGNLGYNPVGLFSITVTASPFTYTAGASPETIFINAGTVSLVTVNSVNIFQQSNCSVQLEPFKSMIVTYTVAPTMIRSIS